MLDVVELTAVKPQVASELEDFDQTIALYQQRIYRLLLAQIGEPDVAEDLTQECFIRAFQNRSRFRGESQVFTWLARIAINLARDYFRNRRLAFWRRLSRLDNSEEENRRAMAVPDRSVSPEDLVIQREKLASVMELVKQLSQPQRETLLLSVIEEMSLDEISRCTNRRIGTVKTHLFRALMNLRKWQEGKNK